jgi:phage terminase small subunit
MPILPNPRHESFAQALAKGKSAAEAYVAAGYKDNRSAASRLSTNVNVAARVAELQGKAAERAILTVEDIARQLDEDRTFARENGAAAAAVSATMGKAKVLGLIVEKHDVSGSISLTVSPEDAEL